MKIERYQPGKRKMPFWLLSCGCLGLGSIGIVMTAIIAMMVFPRIPSMVLANFGLEEIGDTTELLNASGASVPALMDVQTVGSVTMTTGSFSQTLSGAGNGYAVVIGDTQDTMQLQMQVSFTEEGLRTQCQELTTICSSSGDIMRNASFDLRPGGIVIDAEFAVQGIWQDAGLVVQFGNNNRLQIVGVEIGGRVYAPTSTDLANLVNEAETQANLFMEQMSARAGINNFNLSTIVVDDNTLTLIMR